MFHVFFPSLFDSRDLPFVSRFFCFCFRVYFLSLSLSHSHVLLFSCFLFSIFFPVSAFSTVLCGFRRMQENSSLSIIHWDVLNCSITALQCGLCLGDMILRSFHVIYFISFVDPQTLDVKLSAKSGRGGGGVVLSSILNLSFSGIISTLRSWREPASARTLRGSTQALPSSPLEPCLFGTPGVRCGKA